MNIKECLEKMTSEELESLYEKLNAKTIEDAENFLISVANNKTIYLTDDELKLLSDFDGVTLNDYLIDNALILKVDGKYLVSEEVKLTADAFINDAYASLQRKSQIISFYVMINGKISLKNAKRLCRRSGVSISMDELMSTIRTSKLKCDHNFLYNNVCVEQNNSEPNEYKAYNIHNIMLINKLISNYYPSKIEKLIGKYVSKLDNENQIDFFYELCVYAMIGHLSLSFYDDVFKKEKIKLSKNVRSEFNELITEINKYLPNFLYGGNPLILQNNTITEEEYYKYVNELINKVADNTPCWIYNGFTPNENAKNKKGF